MSSQNECVCTHSQEMCVSTHSWSSRTQSWSSRRPSAPGPEGNPKKRRQLRAERGEGIRKLRSSRRTRKKIGSIVFCFSSLPPYIGINVVDDWLG